ncbi:MAG: class I SAM-dependent RNA methyltransferase [Pyrinomonadaceae bacterium]
MEVTIERILPGGLGLAHAEGKTIMVALAALGDRLRVRVDRVKGNVSFASIEEVIEPSPFRIEPPCPYFGRCGGCNFQQMSYEAQLNAKVEIIKDCLHRIAALETLPEIEIVLAPNQWRYRARAQWQYEAVRKRLGYFESGSRRVCDVAECAVLAPELQQSLALLRDLMKDNWLPEARDFRAVVGDKAVAISPSVRSPTVREGNPVSDSAEIVRTIGRESYALSAESFFQTNIDLLPELIQRSIGDVLGETAIDLYCGVGLFTVPLARKFKHVIGVEGDTVATSFARRNLAAAGLTNVSIANQDVARWLEENLERAGSDGALDSRHGAAQTSNNDHSQSGVETAALQNSVDFLLLDPPRTGAESRVIAGILQLQPKRICYVSCDPATLARDLKKLIGGGYSLDSLVAFDMFPQTHHVETIAQLSG